MRRLVSSLMICLLLTGAGAAAGRRNKKSSKSRPTFEYYLLSLSWAPNYCAGHPADKTNECKAGNHTAFVLHGLWPQSQSGPPPMSCKPATPVPASLARHMLEFFPSRTLVQHEWAKHGTCSGLSSEDYFNNVEQAFTSVKVPEQYHNLQQPQKFTVKDIEQAFASANSAPPGAFRVSCHAGELVSLEVCLDKDLHYQACSKSAKECSGSQVLMRPPE